MKIYINQSGYLPSSNKTAILAQPQQKDETATVLTEKVQVSKPDGSVVLECAVVPFGWDEASGDYIWHADFSSLAEDGTYFLRFRDKVSYPFAVSSATYNNLNILLSKALFFQRCGMELKEEHAGKFARKTCHTAPSVLWDEYQKVQRGELSADAMQKFDIRGGWHDAGDYGRYTTAAACALAHILYAYRFFPNAFANDLNIPESGNGIPDILNECRYELDWMMQMQAEDGSVYHKQTTQNHAAFVMPCDDTNQMLLLPASSMAAADFVATMALASRIYRPFDADFADKALAAAKKSDEWLLSHPEFLFEHTPDCHTGGYGDRSDLDERLWAAMELYRCTGEASYLMRARDFFNAHPHPLQYGWADISGFAGWALLEPELMSSASAEDTFCSDAETDFRQAYKTLLFQDADQVSEIVAGSGYHVALQPREYGWGSNLTVLNRAMLLGTAYLLDPQQKYYNSVVSQMDYLLGVNATDYSYVTGVGAHAFCNPHNRVTVADTIEETIPGYVSGGANAHPGDALAKELIAPDTPPMKCFADRWECYSLNEITIYWNSPAIFAAAFLDSTK